MAHQRGFGLVELMVALVLGLIVVGGAAVMFTATKQASTSTDNLSRIQESVRTSYDLLVREVREAGGTPCDAQVLMSNVLVNGQGAAPTWWAAWHEGLRTGEEPLRGFDGATAFPGAAAGAGVGQRVAGTAALMVRYGVPIEGLLVSAHVPGTTTFTANRANHGLAAGDLLMVCTYARGAIFQATTADTTNGTFTHTMAAANPGNCSVGLGPFATGACTAVGVSYQFPANAQIGRFIAAGWYIGNNGRAGTGGRSLYRVTRDGAEEVADGVRDMQLSYLVAGAADYVGAAAVADWTAVTAVRFNLVYEGPDLGSSTAASAPRLTRNVAFTVNLRNLQP